ncbi:MAG: hypothetical protein OEV93_02560 [Candidatus Moranbacteria bacterium]|nr:hypothetical protein [Candidatus Moranbacteria bacterium]
MSEKEKGKGDKDRGEWKTLIQGFVTNMLSRVSENISERIQAWVKNTMKRGIGLFLMMIGGIFVMVSVSLFLNTVLTNHSPWAGYGVVGAVSCCIGMFLGKK